MEKVPQEIYDEFEKEATRYIDTLFTDSLKQETYSLKFAREMAKTAYIAGKVVTIGIDRNKK